MPMGAAYARKLLRSSKARRVIHHAFFVIQLTQPVASPDLRPITLDISIQLATAELLLVTVGPKQTHKLLRILVDLQTDLPARLRRRAAHRRRRRLRGRYRAVRRQGLPYRLRRPNLRRSTWGALHRRSLPDRSPTRAAQPSAIIRWRVEAIERVVAALRRYIPISHVQIRELAVGRLSGISNLTPAERREALINAYGHEVSPGRRVPRCGYCGTSAGSIEVDHILPISRGGTDAWSNLTLACKSCNRRKGSHTPKEAGMRLIWEPSRLPASPRRTNPYLYWTSLLLRDRLDNVALAPAQAAASEPTATTPNPAPNTGKSGRVPTFVAKPISRQRKQVYTARNLSQNTPLGQGIERVGNVVKKRTRVNNGLIISSTKPTRIRVISAGELTSNILSTAPSHHIIRLGLLCAARRSGQRVVGIVSAVHSLGRLTLLTIAATDANRITWKRVVVSPRQELQVLSNDRVIFLPAPPEKAASPSMAGTPYPG